MVLLPGSCTANDAVAEAGGFAAAFIAFGCGAGFATGVVVDAGAVGAETGVSVVVADVVVFELAFVLKREGSNVAAATSASTAATAPSPIQSPR